jgi:hypothetical protein
MVAFVRIHVFYFAILAIALSTSPLILRAQQTADAPDAPIPAAILAAKHVFVSNVGADSGLFPHPFSGAQDRVYNQFYAAMQKWGRYELVAAPDDADLVFEVCLLAPVGPANPNKQKGASDPLPTFRLSVVERKSHYTLWTVNETVQLAYMQKTHDRNFDDALAALVGDVQKISGASQATAKTAEPSAMQ